MLGSSEAGKERMQCGGSMLNRGKVGMNLTGVWTGSSLGGLTV